MSQIQIADQLTDDAVLYALSGSVAFLSAFLIFDPRLRRSSIGKALLILDTGLAGLEAPSVLHRFLGVDVAQAWFAWYYLATVVLVGTGVWWRTLIMIAAQLRKRAGSRRSGPSCAQPEMAED